MNRIILILALLLLNVAANAQDYQAYRLYELNGPVKQVSIKTEDPFYTLSKKVDFSVNGMQKFASWVYDENGWPIGEGFCGGSTFWNTTVVLDSHHRPVSILRTMNGDKKCPIINMNTKFFFDANGNVAKKEVSYKDTTTTYIFEYSNYILDEKGNWIQRSVTMSQIEAENRSKNKSFTETRTIKYW